MDGIIQPKQSAVRLSKGPDPSLRKGPQARAGLKLKLDKGPDPDLRKGSRALILGPQGPSVIRCNIGGSDPNRRKGADSSLRIVRQIQEVSWDE